MIVDDDSNHRVGHDLGEVFKFNSENRLRSTSSTGTVWYSRRSRDKRRRCSFISLQRS